MVLYFITGNKNKFLHAKSILPNVEMFDFDLPEIQELDVSKIIEAKLRSAAKLKRDEFFCEDVSFEVKGLNGLPGPFVKWFLKSVGNEGIYDMARNSGDVRVSVKIMLGYFDGEKVKIFEDEIRGEVVSPRGENGFGWDKIFRPVGSGKSFAEMEMSEKSRFGMRRRVLEELRDYLANREQ